MKKFIDEMMELQEAKSAKGIDAVVAKLEKLTDHNDHNGSVIEGAKFLKHKKIENCMKLVAKIHEMEGHMPDGLYQYRRDILKELLAYAKRELSKEDYEKFHGAF